MTISPRIESYISPLPLEAQVGRWIRRYSSYSGVMITCCGSRLAAMKKIRSGTLNQNEKRETTNAIEEAKSRMTKIAGTAISIEFQKCSGIWPCDQACR